MSNIKKNNKVKFTLFILAFALLQCLLLMAKLVPNPPFPDMPWWVVFLPLFALALLLIAIVVLVFILTEKH